MDPEKIGRVLFAMFIVAFVAVLVGFIMSVY